MAGEEDSNKKQPPSPESSRQLHDDENPFVALRRFADEQFSSMLQAVVGLPSSFGPPRSERWTIFDEESYRDHQRRQRENYTENNGDGETNNADAPSTSGSQNSTNNDITPTSKSQWPSESTSDINLFFDSFFDRCWLSDSMSSRLFYPYRNPPFSTMTSSQSPIWPVNYLMFSPYSPLHLERHARYRSRRDQGVFSSLMSSMSFSSEADHDPDEPRWREAFEDLLRLENGKAMLDRDSGSLAKRESGYEWLQGLVKRGSLGTGWKFSAGSDAQPSSITLDNSRREDRSLTDTEQEQSVTPTSDEAHAKPLTEQDMYDRFLADIDAREREFASDFHNSPLLRFLLEERRRNRNGLFPSERDFNDETETWLELVSGGSKKSVPDTQSTETPLEPAPAALESPVTTDKASAENYVVSTQTSTSRVTLPDGSIQTKIVKTKRFADGRVETDSSTDVSHPPQREGGSESDGKSGWFWRD
ncbi:uncharacterized protein BDV17DRAFT_276331 [Aspergillus undulatus]|uniref:uncharacterized protein n=1 Tax=Aspergillus undulatus TaxID=1810928 RepID=UPI003CCE4C6B